MRPSTIFKALVEWSMSSDVTTMFDIDDTDVVVDGVAMRTSQITVEMEWMAGDLSNQLTETITFPVYLVLPVAPRRKT